MNRIYSYHIFLEKVWCRYSEHPIWNFTNIFLLILYHWLSSNMMSLSNLVLSFYKYKVDLQFEFLNIYRVQCNDFANLRINYKFLIISVIIFLTSLIIYWYLIFAYLWNNFYDINNFTVVYRIMNYSIYHHRTTSLLILLSSHLSNILGHCIFHIIFKGHWFSYVYWIDFLRRDSSVSSLSSIDFKYHFLIESSFLKKYNSIVSFISSSKVSDSLSSSYSVSSS